MNYQSGSASRSLFRLRASIVAAACALQGCAGLTHFNDVSTVRTADGGKSQLLLMDAKQRVVFPTTHRVRDANGKVVEIFRAFCAEPSPDALSALAAQFGASVSIETKADVSANGGFAESAANIGLRTASIQTLRDSMYRQCEAFANGGMSRLSLETLQRRFQSTMVALLAIEQLTGAVRAPSVVLNGATASNNAEVVASLTKQTEAAQTAVDEAVADVAVKERASTAAADKAKTAAEKAEEDEKLQADADKAQTEADTAAKALTAAQTVARKRMEAFEAIDASRRASLTAGGTATSGGTSTFGASAPGLNADAAKAVSTAVTDIVHDTLALGYGREVCTSILGQSIETDGSGSAMLKGTTAGGGDVLAKCLNLLQEEINFSMYQSQTVKAQAEMTAAAAKLLTVCTDKSKCALAPDQLTKVIEAAKAPETSYRPFSLDVTR